MAAFVDLRLLAAHPGVVQDLRILAACAVVGHEDQDRIVAKAGLLQVAFEPAEIVVDVGDLTVERRVDSLALVLADLGIRGRIGFDDHVRAVRRVGRQIGEERLAHSVLLADPVHGLVEEDVGAEALVLLVRAVAVEHGVEVRVAPVVGQRGDAPRAVVQRFPEAAVLRAMGVAVAQVPLAEVPGGVAGAPEEIGHRRQFPAHHRTPLTDGGAAVAHRVDARQQLAACRRAHRRHVEVREAHALGVQPVHVRRLQHGIAVSGKITVALVIGHDEDDVGLACRAGGRSGARQCGDQHE